MSKRRQPKSGSRRPRKPQPLRLVHGGPLPPCIGCGDTRETPDHDDSDMFHEMVEAMERVGTRPVLVYAFRKTGRIVTEENAKLLTAEDLAEWHAVCDEWEFLYGSELH